MQEILNEIALSLFYIVIIAILIENLVNESYRKYINIFLGLTVSMVLIAPIVENSDFLKFEFHKSLQRIESEFNQQGIYSQDIYREALVQEYKSKLKDDIEDNVRDICGKEIQIVEMHIYENMDSPDFGKVDEIKIEGEYDGKVVEIISNKYHVRKDKIYFQKLR
ncbi:Sporulation stage III protein AF [Caldicellulosiruptor hydrothermalis 108]|uniref:Sporulation stage III protein AF n=1 Tax=Caldicellulosiruptor hydrothermalis (strain DSM 18901 / VKM B-2411 / 108) TaxID=632292 RepID=E4QCN3_CALH1|nr:stage III sporulation protein AF [Caldicellulosiruptor hydrothermalis]ADQ07450.1 Sporulation stage III protein AF [Caldicellulosiruptor hydrothermalis 108]